jgi:hypothetical protein
MNPSATASAGVGFGEEREKGSIKYVSLQDLQDKKVVLPKSDDEKPKFQ